MIKTYRDKKTVQALQFDGLNISECLNFCPAIQVPISRKPILKVPNDFVYDTCEPTDWIVLQGHIYHVLKDLDFKNLFEEVIYDGGNEKVKDISGGIFGFAKGKF